jgi:methylglutaconyl-CoA hydratase
MSVAGEALGFQRTDAGVEVLCFERPEKRNALTVAMLAALRRRLETLREHPPRAVVVCGRGRVFCAGFDLDEMASGGGALARLLEDLSLCVRLMRRLSCPVVIAAHGGAVAGGCALLSGGDVVVADKEARFGYPVLRLGISPAVTVPGLRRSTGDGAARELTLDTGLIGAGRAEAIGLVHVVVNTPDQVQERASAIAAGLSAKPPHALAATRTLLNRIDGSEDDSEFLAALGVSGGLADGEECRGALYRAVAGRGPEPAGGTLTP